jgi:hypothetical protein
VALDPAGGIYLGGGTDSSDFPVSPDAFQSSARGSDAFVTEMRIDGSGLIFSTLWGGSGGDGIEGFVLDRDRNVYATGCTQSTDFPVTPGAFQATLQGGEALSFGCFGPGAADAFVTKIAFGSNRRAEPPSARSGGRR